MSGDVQPHMTALRKTMVLFKPQNNIEPGSIVTITAKNNDNQVVYQGTMLPPNELTKLMGQRDSSINITPPSSYDRTISDNSTLGNFASDPSGRYFAELFATNNTLHIMTSDGNWTPEFHLPQGSEYTNKIVTFTSNAGYSSTISSSDTLWALSYGNKITLKNIDGVWYSDLDDEFSRITYNDKTYSAIIPAEIVQPGLKFIFNNNDKQGSLTNFEIGAPNELILHTIDIGMLPPPRDGFSFQKYPYLHREYFQHLPIRRLTVSEYEPLHLREVMLPDGRLLTDFDPSEGGVYTGDMRGQIAKLLISHGINNANYGLNSSGSTSESWHPFSSAQITAHNAIGKYSNGIQVHGLSGGAGMVTLLRSIGNEFSHELGHNFGLGHYPGGFDGAINRPANEVNSTWGWDVHQNKFIPNFEKSITNEDMCYQDQCTSSFYGHRFSAGAMSGGWALYNRYTLHTPYELNKIQNFFESKTIFSPESSTGFSLWDDRTQSMQPWHNLIIDDLAEVSYNEVERKPYKQGVAVATLVGYYDPNKRLNSYIYPALHGSFGAVYEDNFTVSSCQMNVFTRNGGKRTFNLHSRRLESGYMNRFHINIEEALEPYSAEIVCDDERLTSVELKGPAHELHTSVITSEGGDVEVDTNANAGVDITAPFVAGRFYHLDGSSSTGEGISYKWVIKKNNVQGVDAAAIVLRQARTATPKIKIPVGTEVSDIVSIPVKLVVTDANGEKDNDTVVLTLNTNGVANQAPVADARVNNSNIQHGDQFTLNGNNSHDADGDSLSYLWEQTSGELVTLGDATRSRININTDSLSNTEQTLGFRLTVSDDEASDSDTVSVHMSPTESGGGNPGGDYEYEYPTGLGSYTDGTVVKILGQGVYQCFGEWAANCNNPAFLPGNALDPNWITQQWRFMHD
ncbi:hypothetical protein G6Z90_13900 [Vibrio aestuarianus subsp. cardii]|uniref:M66 family metalloprotease n=1 Tax=Vibrio aestuarianus TaxID=28171 RepID=UPI00159461AE|nr:M66 family metalloprotease [Vibrio aestuarianus]MDE1312361.1 M66 family metalloprotease [Vibrio aestuarianus]NGZ93583.1 hypothetical protein [Vibrio aestuarianus subsp. cardii]